MTRSLLEKTSSLLFGLDLFGEYFGTITSQDAVRSISARLGARAEYFLKLCRDHVFSSAIHPYRPLFRHAGMTYEGLESLVAGKGLEPALREMAARGLKIQDLGDYNWHTGSVQIVWRDPETGRLHGATDPRRLGLVLGY